MSKIKPDKINFNNSDFVIEITDEIEQETDSAQENLTSEKERIIKAANKEKDRIIKSANAEKEKIINEANLKADEIIKNAKKEAEQQAKNTTNNANKQAFELLENSKSELEKQITASANEGYSAGYNDGLEKIKEELSEKIENFEKFCSIQSEIKNKILKSASNDILNLVFNISRKILPKEINKEALAEIIDKTISLIEKKEDINIILSEKYAKLLYDFQKNLTNDENEFKFENFKQYKGFSLIYNPKFDDDTIIVENPLERYDASVNSQLDTIIRDIYETTQNGKIDNIEQYQNEAE